jgi:DNA end-binding protein Ku
MAARSIASLTVAFGLVAIPVRLYSATVSASYIRFHMLHGRDGSRLRQQYVCLQEDAVVGRDEIVKGYEVTPDQYVMFSAEELKALEEIGTKSIDIAEFVPLQSVDPVYFDTTYYLTPDKGGAGAYSLFVAALHDTRLCAVGKWAMRGRGHVIILRPIENVLALHQLHFAPQVLPISELEVRDTKIRDAELKLARLLIEQQTAERFDPAAYHDEVAERIEAAIRRKVEGKELMIAAALQPAEKVVDLMDALRKSLDQSAGKRASAQPPSTARRKSSKSPLRRVPRHNGAGRAGPRH